MYRSVCSMYIHTCRQTDRQTNRQTACVHTCVDMHIHIYIYIYACMYGCTYACACIFIYTDVARAEIQLQSVYSPDERMFGYLPLWTYLPTPCSSKQEFHCRLRGRHHVDTCSFRLARLISWSCFSSCSIMI